EADDRAGVVELDLELLEEVVPEDEVDARKLALPAHAHADVLAYHAAHAQLVQLRHEHPRLATCAVEVVARAARVHAQPLGGRLREDAGVRAGVDEHADLLAV